MKKEFIIFLLLLCSIKLWAVEDPVEYVNPLMGTQSNVWLSNGNLYPAIARPWGMNFWTPQMGKMGDGWTYTYGGVYPGGRFEQKIRGFKQTHQPSPWINDYGQFSIMPVVGEKVFIEKDRASWFSHKAEKVKAYQYSVYLADYDVSVDLAPTDRACIFEMTYPETDEAYVVIDAFDRGSFVKVEPEKNRIIGYSTRNSGGVPENFKNYFVIQFDQKFTSADLFSDDKLLEGVEEQQGDHVGAVIGFKTKRGEKIVARVASSFISYKQALINLKEVGDRDLTAIAQEGKELWNKSLNRIEVEGGSIDQYRTFYTCLYRSLLFPRKFYELDEKGNVVHYSPYNGKVLPGYMYTDSGFWDTFRCLFPFLNLMYPSVNMEIQEGLINTYKESGFFPEWASPGHRGCMVGNNSASILADAFLQGLKVEDTEALWDGLVNGANNVHPHVSSTGRLGHEYYNKLGYVPCDVDIRESAARTLEYAYDDWCIYQVGKALGKPKKEIEVYAERSLNYKNLFRKDFNLMCGRKENGEMSDPFNPFKWGGDFTEGNSLHYTWSVFHDPQGLINLMGGDQTFNQMLDTVFALPPIFDDSYYGGTIHEIREMQIMNMGNYAHGNQPIQHMIYMYNYSGQPWKTQMHVRDAMDKLYKPTPDGYCGDEDNGQTSAWYVFSAMGFYPVCPGSDQYALGTPLFKKATLHLENGNDVVINAPDNNEETAYIRDLKIDGKEYTKNYFSISAIKEGVVIDIEMSDVPNKSRGVKDKDRPYSFSK
ncbi:GH92 family glycosyl hydrolase [Carboxylicivirga caseinilyticus]|uniref:GH92 family glycosyl hydrolase n=1 Tax=Carboxylicivirga caseinilyticus TaxID=3417572 RepID=UPI003D327406|nr:GH92 family glycosyl hydrolase [Marinilabiliaceae bacterium A049]